MVAAVVLLCQAIVAGPTCHSLQSAAIALLTGIEAILLLTGMWTPITGTLTALIELRNVFARLGNPLICVLLGVMGISIAMIGPGAWSVDARRYGWKRINPQDR